VNLKKKEMQNIRCLAQQALEYSDLKTHTYLKFYLLSEKTRCELLILEL